MPNRDANAIADDWAAKLAASGPKITRGVQSVTVAPGQQAAQRSEAYVAGVQRNASKWRTNVASVSLGDWQQAMTEKGIGRIAQGATSAKPKMAQFLQRALPFIDNAVNSLPPRGDLEANIQRAAAFSRAMSKFSNR